MNKREMKAEFDKAVQMILVPSDKVAAIKLLRAATGWTLKQAKDCLESPDPYEFAKEQGLDFTRTAIDILKDILDVTEQLVELRKELDERGVEI